MKREFQRIAIVNRGEAAMRMIHAIREFNLEHGESLRTIAIFSEADRDAKFVRDADEAVSLGSSRFLDPDTDQLKSSYHNRGATETALTTARADAVWPGWRMLAGNADFADLCAELGMIYIGPDAAAIRLFDDKIAAKRLAVECFIPIASWSDGPVETLAEARHQGDRLGYPLLLKAAAAQEGQGIRTVKSRGDLALEFEILRAHAFEAFGNPTLFMEHLVEGAHRIEVDVISDLLGATQALGVRESTSHPNSGVFFSESPAPSLSPEQHTCVREMAVRICRAAAFYSMGTVKFLFQQTTGEFFFLGMTPFLPAEHSLTEVTTGLDLVKLQVEVARGVGLDPAPPPTAVHAMQLVLTATDCGNHTVEHPARIERLRIPSNPGLRIDTGLAEGDAFSSEFDSTLARITACGSTRKEALSRLHGG
jgi:acetyl/propionyl-CoA carboxylase alpha subunit